MSVRLRLAVLGSVKSGATTPAYRPTEYGTGIVHVGVGAFHRVHQAVCTDDALAAEGGDWRIIGVSLRSTEIAQVMNAQDGLYTLLTRSAEGTSARIVAAIDRVIAASQQPQALSEALTRPQTRIVTMTVSEKAYGIDRANGTVDPDHPAIVHDLATPRAPTGMIGLLVEALRRRRQAGTAPFTVLCCDNLPSNGVLVRSAAVDFAARVDPELGRWIAGNVAFPSTMVDRITPASIDRTRDDARRLTGFDDDAAVETEPFIQWVIEDNFTSGRPQWEAGGAQFVDDVTPFEQAKLRMLNGSHSLIAYAGFLSGHQLVFDAMSDPAIALLVDRQIKSAADTLLPVRGMDLAAYRGALVERFSNPAIAHKTAQIAMDGSEKIPQRILAPAVHALVNGQDIQPFAFAVAVWMRFCLARLDDGTAYELNDPRRSEIARALSSAGQNAEQISSAIHGLAGLFPEALRNEPRWRDAVNIALTSLLEKGVLVAIAREAATGQPGGSAGASI